MLNPVLFRITILALLVLVSIPRVVLAINLNGTWTYRESGGDSGDTFRELRQNYSFGVGPSLSYRPSHALSLNASVGYTQRNGIDDRDSQDSRTITPSLSVSLTNDLFSARMSGNVASTQSDGGNWSNSTSWYTGLKSQWHEPFIPELQISYSELGASKSDTFVSAKTDTKNFGAGIDWDLLFADITYRYREVRLRELTSSESHFVKLDTAGRFWNDRVVFNLSQQVNLQSLEVLSGGLGGTADIPVGKTASFAITSSDTPVEFDCTDILALGSNCLETAVFPIDYPASSHVQLAIVPLEGRQIGAVEISFDIDNVTDNGLGSTWDLYEYSDDLLLWQLVGSDLPVIEVGNELSNGVQTKRLRIEIPQSNQRFMLVSDLRPSGGRITNVDVFELFAGSGRTTQNYQANAGVRLRLSDTVSSSLGLTYERDQSETEGVSEDAPDTDRFTTSVNVSWAPLDFLTAAASVSDYREREGGVEQDISRNYSLIFSTTPLQTVNVSFGVQLNERYGGDFSIEQKTLESMRYSVNGKAQIYPDLSASFSLQFSEGKRWVVKKENDIVVDERFVGNSGQSARVDLNAKLYENLTADLISSYAYSENGEIDREVGAAELGLRFRISELLLVRGSYRTELIGRRNPDSFNLQLQASLLNTDNTRLGAQLSHTQAEESVDNIAFNGSWLIGNKMSLVGRGGYSVGETNSYNLKLDFRIRI